MKIRRPAAVLAEHLTDDQEVQEQIKWQPTAETPRWVRWGYWAGGVAFAGVVAWGAWTDAASNNIGNNSEAAFEGLVAVGVVTDLGFVAVETASRTREQPTPALLTATKTAEITIPVE